MSDHEVKRVRIQEVIVVEGRHDTEKLKKYFDCDTIETGGSSLGKDVIDLIRRAEEKRGVIIFTDPDSAGNRIRHAVNQAVPGCQNAFVDRKNAHTSRKVGVEHAGYEPLLAALQNLVTIEAHPAQRITMSYLYHIGLSGRADSARLRTYIGEKYHIGDGSAKTMLNRLNCLGVSPGELKEAVDHAETDINSIKDKGNS